MLLFHYFLSKLKETTQFFYGPKAIPHTLADIMGFTKLDTPAGLAVLDSYLSDKSYIVSFAPSQADVAVYEAIKVAPKHTNVLRWYNHIGSFTANESKK